MKRRLFEYIRRKRFIGLRIGLLLAVCLITGACADSAPADVGGANKKIAYYKRKIADYSRHYPAHTMLGAAYLERARESGDPADIELARQSVRKSIEIQPSFQAFKTYALIEGFAHRFEESLSWAEKASLAAVYSEPDSELVAIMTDAYLGLGRDNEAEKLVESIREKDFFTSAARGQLFKAQGEKDQAAAAFQDAARFARMQDAGKAEAWAEVMTAGVWLDAGEPDKALRYLDQAARIFPNDKQIIIHRGEYYLARNDADRAARLYETLLRSSDDPVVHHRLFKIERSRGNGDSAQKHFKKAEYGFRKALAGGEINTLGSLAQLLCDAGVDHEEALKLSEKNLRFKKDKEARATHKCLNQ